MESIIKIGEKYNRWTILFEEIKRKNNARQVMCLCECGTQRLVRFSLLVNNQSKSCGCLAKEIAKQLGLERSKDPLNKNPFKIKHGFTKENSPRSPEYTAWVHMKQRCYDPENPEYKNYGGRGISVDPLWKESFIDFYNHIGPRPSKKYSIDRINNELGYFPGNVKWSLISEQNRNHRRNHWIEIDGVTKCLQDWCNEYNIASNTVVGRLQRGWDEKRAITTPAKK